VNAEVMRRTGGPDVRFMHRAPAFRNAETEIAREVQRKHGIDALEVTTMVATVGG
jgi:ornithine carbamoyltransferase